MGMENIFWIIFDNELKEQYGDWKALLATNPNVTASDFSSILALDDEMRADLELLFKIVRNILRTIISWIVFSFFDLTPKIIKQQIAAFQFNQKAAMYQKINLIHNLYFIRPIIWFAFA